MLHLPLNMGVLVSARRGGIYCMTHTDWIGESLCLTVTLCLMNYIQDGWKLAVTPTAAPRYIFKIF